MNSYHRVYTSVDMYGIGFFYKGKPSLSFACRVPTNKRREKVNVDAEFYPNDILFIHEELETAQ